MKLKNKIALVAGATRGAGRGIALSLAEEGAIVYGTGRSIKRDPKFTAIRADHTDERQVARVVSRIRREHGHLDILVNDIWGGEELVQWGKRVWEADVKKGLAMLERAVFTHLITSRHAIPLMLGRKNAVIFEITDGDGMYYRGNIYYDLVKTSVIRLAFAMSEELRRYRIAAIAVTPGFLRSEYVLDHFGVTEENWRDAVKQDPNFIASETPFYVGRCIAALAADKQKMRKSGRVYSSADLATEYKVTDVDGTQPNFRKHIEQHAPEFLFPQLDDQFWRYTDGPYDILMQEAAKITARRERL